MENDLSIRQALETDLAIDTELPYEKKQKAVESILAVCKIYEIDVDKPQSEFTQQEIRVMESIFPAFELMLEAIN